MVMLKKSRATATPLIAGGEAGAGADAEAAGRARRGRSLGGVARGHAGRRLCDGVRRGAGGGRAAFTLKKRFWRRRRRGAAAEEETEDTEEVELADALADARTEASVRSSS